MPLVNQVAKKSKHLQEVEEDAIRIQTRRFKEQLEEAEYQKSKNELKDDSDLDEKGNE